MNGDCIKLTSYFGERHRAGGRFVADALIDLYGRQEMAASILLRGTEGFGLKHHLRTDRSLTLSEDLPLVAVAVDARPRIEAILGDAVRLTGSGLVTLERARMLTAGHSGFPAELPGPTKLTIYVGRQERVCRVPAFVAVCDLLHRRGVAGKRSKQRQNSEDESPAQGPSPRRARERRDHAWKFPTILWFCRRS